MCLSILAWQEFVRVIRSVHHRSPHPTPETLRTTTNPPPPPESRGTHGSGSSIAVVKLDLTIMPRSGPCQDGAVTSAYPFQRNPDIKATSVTFDPIALLAPAREPA
jgi:hypothetical protein